jgi:hypothetical protein
MIKNGRALARSESGIKPSGQARQAGRRSAFLIGIAWVIRTMPPSGCRLDRLFMYLPVVSAEAFCAAFHKRFPRALPYKQAERQPGSLWSRLPHL